MRRISRKMLEEILKAESVEETMEAMEKRLNMGIQYSYLKPKPIKKLIEELDKDLVEWTPEETRKALFKRADRFFDDNIRNVEAGHQPK